MKVLLPEDMRERIALILAHGIHIYELEDSFMNDGEMSPPFGARWTSDVVEEVDKLQELFASMLEETDRKAREEAKQTLNITDRIQLLLAKIEIHKLKANDHDWAVYVPDATKKELEAALAEIDALQSPSKGSK